MCTAWLSSIDTQNHFWLTVQFCRIMRQYFCMLDATICSIKTDTSLSVYLSDMFDNWIENGLRIKTAIYFCIYWTQFGKISCRTQRCLGFFSSIGMAVCHKMHTILLKKKISVLRLCANAEHFESMLLVDKSKLLQFHRVNDEKSIVFEQVQHVKYCPKCSRTFMFGRIIYDRNKRCMNRF